MNAPTSTRPDRMSLLLKSHGFSVLWRRQRFRHAWVWAFTLAAFGSIAPAAIATSPANTSNNREPSADVVTNRDVESSESAPIQVSQAAPSQVLRVGDSGDAVTTLQERLAAQGYYDGPVTGYFGEQTEQAVIEFQTSNGLTADGIVGTGTLAALVNTQGTPAYVEATPGNVREGTTGELVVALQERLAALGYYSGGIDGVFGKATTQAVVQFQENNGLAADGVVGPATEEALRSASAVSASASTPTSPSSPSTSNPSATNTPSPSSGVLRLGDSGRDVIALQSQLQALGYYAGPVDGEFGQSTEAAVIKFQDAQGLVADGLVGPQTTYLLDEQFFAMRSPTSASPAPAPSTTVQPNPAPTPGVSNPTAVSPAAPFPGTIPQNTLPQQTPPAAVSVPTTPTVTGPETSALPPTMPPATAMPSPTPAPSPTTAQVNTQGTESVREVQQELQQQGLYTGPIDGVMNSDLERAILEAQEARGLSPTDIVR